MDPTATVQHVRTLLTVLENNIAEMESAHQIPDHFLEDLLSTYEGLNEINLGQVISKIDIKRCDEVNTKIESLCHDILQGSGANELLLKVSEFQSHINEQSEIQLFIEQLKDARYSDSAEVIEKVLRQAHSMSSDEKIPIEERNLIKKESVSLIDEVTSHKELFVQLSDEVRKTMVEIVTPTPETTIDYIPNEILEYMIFSLMKPKDFANIQQVSKRFRDLGRRAMIRSEEMQTEGVKSLIMSRLTDLAQAESTSTGWIKSWFIKPEALDAQRREILKKTNTLTLTQPNVSIGQLNRITEYCPKLNSLTIKGKKKPMYKYSWSKEDKEEWITNDLLNHIPPQVTSLTLQKCEHISGQGLEIISQNKKNITELTIEDCEQIDDESLKPIAGMSNLTKLILNSSAISGTGLKHLNKGIRLKTLRIQDNEFNNDDASFLESFPELESLTIPALSDSAFKEVAKLTKLKHLELLVESDYPTDEGIGELGTLQNLESLKINHGWHLTPHCLETIGTLHKLKRLEIHIPKFEIETVPFASMEQLEYLEIRAPVTEKILDDLKELPMLQGLYVKQLVISSKGLQTLKIFPKLKDIYLDNLFIPDNSYKAQFSAVEKFYKETGIQIFDNQGPLYNFLFEDT